MMEALKREADAWLSRLIEELRADPFYRDGWDLLKRVEQEIRFLAPPLREAVKLVLCDWLHQWGTYKVDYALDIIALLKVRECLPVLLDLWTSIVCGRLSDLYAPYLDSFWLSDIERVIRELDVPLPEMPLASSDEKRALLDREIDDGYRVTPTAYSADVERWLLSLDGEPAESPGVTWDERVRKIVMEILSQSDEFQSEVSKVVCSWLDLWETDLQKVALAIDLSARLKLREACPYLLELRRALQSLKRADPLGARYNFLWLRRLDEALKAINCE